MAAALPLRSYGTHLCAIMATLLASIPLPAGAEPRDLRRVIANSGPYRSGTFRDNLRIGVTLRLPLDGGFAPDARRARVGLGLAMRHGYGAGDDFVPDHSMRLSRDTPLGGAPILSVEFRIADPGDPVLNGLEWSAWRRLYAEETGAEEDEGGSNALWRILGGVGLAAGVGIAAGAARKDAAKDAADAIADALCKALGGPICPPPKSGG